MSLYNEEVTVKRSLPCCTDCTPEFCNPSEVKGSWEGAVCLGGMRIWKSTLLLMLLVE